MIREILRNKYINRDLTIEVVQTMKHHGTVKTEAARLWHMTNGILQATSINFFRAVAESGDPQLTQMLVEADVGADVTRIHETEQRKRILAVVSNQ
jgi:hypothetical protein